MSNDFHYQIRIQRDGDESPSYLSKGGGVAKFDSIDDAEQEAEDYAVGLDDSTFGVTEISVVMISERVVSKVGKYRSTNRVRI